ncbi:P2X purinoceptor 7-like [Protopterus annectens]|uniref:P2X purinoceptor 7-like n=1 Tax=Protopterus annectens TaxID=7888 RepID=UPI001CF93D21|nr:P2X purinoceptor 7-like [Protopterus annectens]
MASQRKFRSIVPYSFEPVYKEGECPPKRSRRSSSSSEDEEPSATITGETRWCSCQQCIQMSSSLECYCCASSPRACVKMNELDPAPRCITEHSLFGSTCLTTHFLHILMRAMYVFRGNFRQTNWTNSTYRFVAYRAYVLWMYENRKLGYGHRVVIPSCVVNKIRQRFPSDEADYTGFKPFEGFWMFD